MPYEASTAKLRKAHSKQGTRTDPDAVVVVCGYQSAVQDAREERHKVGLDSGGLSLTGKDHFVEELVTDSCNAGGKIDPWGGVKKVWNGLLGWLLAAASFRVPGVGALLGRGPLVASIIGARVRGCVRRAMCGRRTVLHFRRPKDHTDR